MNKPPPRKVPFADLAPSLLELLDHGCKVRLRVEGDSMSPFLAHAEDEVILVHPRSRSWGRDDIVLIRNPSGRPVLHRVTRRARGSIWLRGDAQRIAEGPWPEDQVLALVDSVIRNGQCLAMTSPRARLHALLWRMRRAMPGAANLGRRLEELRWVAAQTRGIRGRLLALAAGGALLSLFGVAFAVLSKSLVDRASGAEPGGLAAPLIAMAGLVLAQVATQAAFGLASSRLSAGLETRLRAGLYDRLQRAAWLPLQRQHSGEWVTRLTADVNTVSSGLAGVLPDAAAQTVRLIAALACLARLDPVLAAAALAAGPLFLFPGRLLAGRLRRLAAESRDNEGRLRGFLQETLRRSAVVKTFGLESLLANRLDRLHDESLALTRRQAWTSTVPGAGLSLGYWAGYLLALAAGAVRIQAGHATFGTLTAFLQLVGQVQSPFQGLARAAPRLIALLASAERIREAEALPSERPAGARPAFPPAWHGVDISFRGVSFGYGPTRVLENVTFDIRSGERVVLTGPSGGGKTTLLRLLLGLVTPDRGAIEIRETAPAGRHFEAGPAARPCFAFVPQGNSLLSGTLGDNIRHGRPDALPEAVNEAAIAACAEPFIRERPQGLESRIGESGDGLSEGQAQRIALARAFLRNAPVLMMDEATSALDLKTEREVLEGLSSRAPGMTVILVSHRPEALVGADRVLRVEHGRVVEETGDESRKEQVG